MATPPTITDQVKAAWTKAKATVFPHNEEFQANEHASELAQQIKQRQDAFIAKRKSEDAAQYNITSLKDLTVHNDHLARQSKEYAQAYSSADPNSQPTKELGIAALKGKLVKIYTSPEFHSLTTGEKDYVSKRLFNDWVVPALQDQGIKPPSYQDWIVGQGQHPEPEKPKGTFTDTLESTVAKGVGRNLTLAGNLVSQLFGYGASEANNKAAMGLSSRLKSAAGVFNKVDTDYRSAFNVPDTKSQWVANIAGQVITDAPIYIAAEATGGAALGETAIGETVGTGLTPRLLSLAKRFAPSKAGQIALRGLIDFGEVGGISKEQGSTTKESAEYGAGAFILGPAFHGIFHGLSGVKGLMAKTISRGADKAAIGGEALANTIEHTTPEEISESGSLQDALKKIQIPASTKDRIYSNVADDDPHFVAAKQAEMKMREAWAQEIFPELKEKYPGKVWNNISKTNRARLMQFLAHMQGQGPELMSLVEPEIQSEANAKELAEEFKTNPALSKDMQAIIGNTGLKPEDLLTETQASNAAKKNGLDSAGQRLGKVFTRNPTDLPFDIAKSKPRYGMYKLDFDDPRDLALYTIGQANKNKAHDRFMSYLLKQFPGKSESELRAMGREVKGRIQKAIPDTEGDTIKVPSVRERVATKPAVGELNEDYEPIEGESASLGVGHKVAYLAAPKTYTKVQLSNPTLPIDKFLEGTTKYLEDNPYTASGHLYFEHPKMHLLQVAFNSDAPALVANRAKSILRTEFNTPAAKAAHEAKWLSFHVDKLREAGHLEGGNNPGKIFRSTKLLAPRFGTSWQKEVTPDIVGKYMSDLRSGLNRVDPILAKAVNDVFDRLTAYADRTNTPDTAAKRLSQVKKLREDIGDVH